MEGVICVYPMMMITIPPTCFYAHTVQCANVASVEEAMVRSAVQQSLLECTATNDQYVLSAVICGDEYGRALFYRCEEDSREIEYLSSAIRILGDSVDKNITVRIEIRRSCVVKDALREARKSKFNPSGVLKVSLTYTIPNQLNSIISLSRSILHLKVQWIKEVLEGNFFAYLHRSARIIFLLGLTQRSFLLTM